MLRPILLSVLLFFFKIGFSQTKVETLINNCLYSKAFSEISKHPNTLENQYNQAILLMHFGAMEMSKLKCYQVIQQAKNPVLLAKTYQLLFDISYYLTDIEAERKYADSSYYFYKKIYGDNSIYKAQYNINLSRYYNYFRRNDLSKTLSIEALEITRRFRQDRIKIDLPMVYSQYYASFRNDPVRQNYDSAIIYTDSALYWHEQIYNGAENFSKIKLYHMKGLVYLDCNTQMTSNGKWKQGKRYLLLGRTFFEKANKILTTNIGNQHVLLSYSNALIGLMHLQQREYSMATKYLDIAESNLYPNSFSKNFISTFTINLMGIYDWQNNCSYSQYYETGKLFYLQQALQTARKSEVIYDLLLQEGKYLNDYYSHIPYQKLASIYYELYQKTKKEIYLDSSFFYAEKEKIADLINRKRIALKQTLKLTSIEREKVIVDKEILIKNNSLFKLFICNSSKPVRTNQEVYKQILSVGEIQHKIQDDSSAIILMSHYNLPVRFPPMVTVHVITKTDHRHKSFIMSKSIDLKDPIEDLMKSLVSSDLKTFKKASNTIFRELFAPWQYIVPPNVKKLQICSVNKFRNFPFEVIISDTTGKSFLDQPYLFKKYAISYLISPSYTFSKNNTSQSPKMYVFNPDFTQTDKSELPFNKNCSQWINSTFDNTIFSSQTKISDLKICLNNGSTIHLATHAVGFDDYTNESRIYTSDTPLFLMDLYKMELKQNPFVVLTCCEADKGNLQFNVGNDNFSRAFSYAGANAVLSTLWSIDDKASSELMKHFYEYLALGMDKSTALQQAKLFILNDSTFQAQAPFYWAASVLTGDISSIELQSKKTFSIISILIIVLLIYLFVLLWKRFFRKKFK